MPILLTVAAILGLTALFSYINARFLHLPTTIGLMLLALTFTLALMLLDGRGLAGAFAREQAFVTRLSLDQTLLNGLLCFMLFAGSINVKYLTLGEEKWVILTLAIGATLIGACFTGLALWWLLGPFGFGPWLGTGVALGLVFALVFGAVVSPTDPIAVLAILGKVGLPPRLEAIINGESLFNDGVGVVIFTITLTLALGTQQPTAMDAALLFLREVLGGVGLGLVAAAMMHYMLIRIDDYGTQVLISLAVVTIGYVLAERIEVSGPIAMVVTGLLAGNLSLPRLPTRLRTPFETFWRGIDEVLNAILFVVIGLHIAIVPEDASLLWTATIAIAACLAARWASVFLSLNALALVGGRKGQTLGLTNLLTWGGLRGGLAIAMALSMPDIPEKGLLLHMTYGVVAFSIIVQGLSIGRIFGPERLARMLE